jgi:tetratricopeptide (TPR) repeat protein
MRYIVVLLMIFYTPFCWPKPDFANKSCPQEATATVISLQGNASFDPEGKGSWHDAQLNEKLCEGGRVWVKPNSRASLSLPGNDVLRLNENTVITLKAISPNKASLLDIVKGFIHFIARKPKEVKIESGIANAAPLGTEFAFSVDESKAGLWVYEGSVKFYNQQGSLNLKPGETAEAYLGKAPQMRIDIKPQDAVNWALYYPPLLPYSDDLKETNPDISAAIKDFHKGRIDLALQRLDAILPTQQTPHFYKVRGAMRLIVGQVEEARQDIRALLANKPNDADALALQSVIALTQNRKDEAFALANKAITSNPQSSTAYAALSYAEQGRFNLDKALIAAATAVNHAPHDAMAVARKAELELSQGLISDSEQTAQQALHLDANLERTQTVMGFAHLSSMDTEEAMQAFNKAVELDSASPLARLGLGLAKIRDGNLEEGRRDIEIAAILDPNNSLIRSYLGKAYYEENRNDRAEDQFKLAKERDPKDPTPYFYDALKKQTDNRPIEALHDLQKAMELNDNRAIYRSKQLLDSDRAARGATLARIYDNLGFQQRGVVEAISSLQTDPTNYSAHRFLSDSYVNQPGQETAQLSELLQAKLLQPININPVQPHLSVSQRGLLNATGIANSSFQDFTRVFEGNRPQLLVSGVAGNQGVLGDEVTLSGIANKFSYSLGQFHYGTDGFIRPYGAVEDKSNTDQRHNIYDTFLQWAITDRINAQFEYINRKTQQGSIGQNIDDTGIVYTERDSLRESIYRGGANLRVFSDDHLLLSYINSSGYERNDAIPGNSSELIEKKIDTDFYEAQFLHQSPIWNSVNGFNYYLKKTNTPANPQAERSGYMAYTYENIKLPANIIATLGLTYDYIENELRPKQYPKALINPKFGILWNIQDNTKLRLAYFRGNKKPINSLQTIEPTQIAGFKQFFDDFSDRYFTFYGAGIDYIFKPNFLTGTELSRREVFNHLTGTKALEKDTIKVYLNWTPSDSIAVSSGYKIIRDIRPGRQQLSTHSLSLEARYFDPSGFFGKIMGTYINQSKTTPEFIGVEEVDVLKRSSFFLLDMSIGFRLPSRFGIVSLEGKNLLDKRFRYEDLGIDQSSVFYNATEFTPQRTIFGRITFNF